MTRLMRVNKQLHEEVHSILWSEFALSLWNFGVKENHTD